MNKLLILCVGGILSALSLSGCGQDSSAQTTANNNQTATAQPANTATPKEHQADVAKALMDNLAKSGIDAKVKAVVPTDMPNMYWATFDKMEPVFVDKTGQYILQGSMVKIGSERPVDIGGKMMSVAAKANLDAADKSEMIIFPAKGETKTHIYVFSDPTCHYCQKLHSEINDINSKGVEVRYLAWPRGEELVALSEAVWCSKDRNSAITRAKQGEHIQSASCDNPVRKHMALGHSLGVSGTPAVFAENGMQLGGYLPSDDLAKAAISNKN